jgi:hypothetical protein
VAELSDVTRRAIAAFQTTLFLDDLVASVRLDRQRVVSPVATDGEPDMCAQCGVLPAAYRHRCMQCNALRPPC